jgi:hypothetical protein
MTIAQLFCSTVLLLLKTMITNLFCFVILEDNDKEHFKIHKYQLQMTKSHITTWKGNISQISFKREKSQMRNWYNSLKRGWTCKNVKKWF